MIVDVINITDKCPSECDDAEIEVKKMERLNELERLFEHCRLWGDGSVENGISKFEAFMQIGEIDWIARNLETANKDLAHSIKMLNTIQAAGESVG